jgi:hypothetical protein
MFCTNCGNKVSSLDKYCESCGTQLNFIAPKTFKPSTKTTHKSKHEEHFFEDSSFSLSVLLIGVFSLSIFSLLLFTDPETLFNTGVIWFFVACRIISIYLLQSTIKSKGQDNLGWGLAIFFLPGFSLIVLSIIPARTIVLKKRKTVSQQELSNILELAEVYFDQKEYSRCDNLLSKFVNTNYGDSFLLLRAKALIGLKELNYAKSDLEYIVTIEKYKEIAQELMNKYFSRNNRRR